MIIEMMWIGRVMQHILMISQWRLKSQSSLNFHQNTTSNYTKREREQCKLNTEPSNDHHQLLTAHNLYNKNLCFVRIWAWCWLYDNLNLRFCSCFHLGIGTSHTQMNTHEHVVVVTAWEDILHMHYCTFAITQFPIRKEKLNSCHNHCH